MPKMRLVCRLNLAFQRHRTSSRWACCSWQRTVVAVVLIHWLCSWRNWRQLCEKVQSILKSKWALILSLCIANVEAVKHNTYYKITRFCLKVKHRSMLFKQLQVIEQYIKWLLHHQHYMTSTIWAALYGQHYLASAFVICGKCLFVWSCCNRGNLTLSRPAFFQ